MSAAAPLTAYRVHRSDGTTYVTNMAAGVTLAQARAYFIGAFQYYDEAEIRGARVVNVTNASTESPATPTTAPATR